ncbi:hypothetical protein EJB05_34976 [Eragrostis curvula]|uniref:Ras-related protein Rab-21 n=1 Tax=Eragrostis curvula TaxID=38414 RepID=A0A5J9U6T4_9POAL|nr:hypothetical protein EJB05_34976 [Eragrostis curvula]
MGSRPPNVSFKLVLLGDGRVGKTSLVLRYVNDVFSDKQEATVQASYLTKRLVVEVLQLGTNSYHFYCHMDTAGQEKFHALGPIYYRDADAALLVYDITDSDTFLRVTKWVKELQQMASKDIVMAIAANKSDLVRLKSIDTQDAARVPNTEIWNLGIENQILECQLLKLLVQNRNFVLKLNIINGRKRMLQRYYFVLKLKVGFCYAESIGASLFVTSAKAGTGIDDVFSDIAKRLLEKRKNSSGGLSPPHPKKGILIVADEPEKEPPPKCCS